MNMTKSLFIAAVFNLKIKDDLNNGIEIWDKIKITNNKTFINSLITEDLSVSIGGLEENALRNANTIFYAIDHHNIDNSNNDEIVCNYLANCKIFLQDLWLIKDNCSDLMMGFIQYPYITPNNSISLPYTNILTHSNILTGGFSDSEGNHHQEREFSKAEVERAAQFFKEDNRKILPFSETSTKPTLLEKGMPRLTLAGTLTQTARAQNDLGIKISHYCTALESLFLSDITELAHRLSERVAYFLENEPEKRKEIFKQAKEIYSIRSKVVHGSPIASNNLKIISKRADEILRRVFIKLQETPDLDKYFRRNSNNMEFEEYMNSMILGIIPPIPQDAPQ